MLVLAAAMCLIVVNHESGPVTLYGCVPAADWEEVQTREEACDPVPDPLVVTVGPRSVTVFPDSDERSYRLWDDPRDVDLHWRWGCPADGGKSFAPA